MLSQGSCRDSQENCNVKYFALACASGWYSRRDLVSATLAATELSKNSWWAMPNRKVCASHSPDPADQESPHAKKSAATRAQQAGPFPPFVCEEVPLIYSQPTGASTRSFPDRVEMTGLEPVTSWLQTTRSPS